MRRGRAVGSGACEAVLVGRQGVAWSGDVVAESMATTVGDTRCSDVVATSVSHAVAMSWPRLGRVLEAVRLA
jgi:hypothetical protein